MTLIQPPIFVQAGTYPAQLDRLALAALLPPDLGTGAIAARGGTRPTSPTSGLRVTQRTTPGMGVTVTAGSALVPAPSANGGVEVLVNAADYDVPLAAAHPTLGRRDLIVGRVYNAEYAGTDNQATIEVVAGTPAGSPVTPAVPSGAVPLAVVLVGAGTTAITTGAITDLRGMAAALGGTIPAAALPATPHLGMCAYDTTAGAPQWWSGTEWASWRDEGYQTAADVAATLSPYSPAYAHDEGGIRTVGAIETWLDFTSAPSVTVTVPPSGRVLAIWGFSGFNRASEQSTVRMAPRLTGGNDVFPSSTYSAVTAGPNVSSSSNPVRSVTKTKLFTGLSPGATTFTLMARVSNGGPTTHQICDSYLYVQPSW